METQTQTQTQIETQKKNKNKFDFEFVIDIKGRHILIILGIILIIDLLINII